jgi:ABC-2 type transport system ATP-binding protein
MNNAVMVKDVSVTLEGGVAALRNVSIDLPMGKTIGFIGPSGAGKTTLIRTIVGTLSVASGKITVLGEPAGSPAVRHKVSYMTQGLAVYPDLTVRENLEYFATMVGVSRRQRAAVVAKTLQTVELTDKTNTLVSSLSGGQKQRVSLAVALLGEPQIMVLDEPTTGLDPVLRDTLWQLFNQLAASGVTLIISSHAMDEAERCDDLVLIRDGQILAHATPTELRHQTKSKTIEQSFLQLVGEGKEASE